MRVPRSELLLGNRPQHFHVISRIVGRELILGEEEKSFFHDNLRNFESFSGVVVLSYCLMDNHFHLLIHIPAKPPEISEEEVFRRMRFIYSDKQIAEFQQRIEEEEAKGNSGYRERFLEGQRRRMYNLSEFVKEIKQRFSRWYNRNHDRKGTLWEDRFKSVVVEGNENALLRVAAYIELNPVRAGLVQHPRNYRWTSYAEALKGSEIARLGIQKLISGRGSLLEWKEAEAAYRGYFEHRSLLQAHRRQAVTNDGSPVAERSPTTGGAGKPDNLLERIRYFTEGLILGSRE